MYTVWTSPRGNLRGSCLRPVESWNHCDPFPFTPIIQSGQVASEFQALRAKLLMKERSPVSPFSALWSPAFSQGKTQF